MVADFNSKYVKVYSGKKTKYEDIIKAIGYWVLLNDLTAFFKETNMPAVHYHVAEACKEIDRLWQLHDSELN